jgi:hypothetical protein
VLLALAAGGCLRQDLDTGTIIRRSAPPATATPSTPGVYLVGQTALTSRGNTVTVHGFETGLPADRQGIAVAAADIEACTATTAATQTRVDPRLFELEFTDQTRRPTVDDGPKSPALEARALRPGRCTRGWIHFEHRDTETPEAVVLQLAPPIRWRIT